MNLGVICDLWGVNGCMNAIFLCGFGNNNGLKWKNQGVLCIVRVPLRS